MSSGQMMLVVCALTLLGIMLLSANRTYTSSGQTLQCAALGITAISLSTSIIQEAQGKSFDAATDTGVATSLSNLSTTLGPETGETDPDFNDFDDYNGLVRTQSFANSGTFKMSCTVVYVDTSNPNGTSSTPTWHKKLTVSVTSPMMRDTIKEYYIFSYFYFR